MTETRSVSTDDAFRLLACRQRRIVLQQLRDNGGTATREQLVETVGQRVSGDVAVTLHHRDLPMLEQHGLIEFDGAESISYRQDEFVETLLTCVGSQ